MREVAMDVEALWRATNIAESKLRLPSLVTEYNILKDALFAYLKELGDAR
jgi:hypothetical protein